ncbi:hypothetical protein O3P69_002733 [Scylla paramamosain]|uniref:Bestrophin homolog n=1 Tax=Scylla paramamosain TaxID=85552 RepID=A0AAW0UNF9_SCYPA
MTVSYTKKVSDCKGFGSFWRLLFRWRGSLYKLVWPDTCVYCMLYFLCSMVYRFGLDEEQRRIFEHVALYCDYFRNLIPISFVLGFYVSVVVQRWWEQYLSIPWPDSLALLCTAYIGGRGERERSIRATVLRYVNLCCALTFSTISPRVGRKFPSYKELMEAGYLTPREMKVLENQRGRSSAALTTLPMMWACKVVEGARTCGYVRDDHGLRLLVAELMALRDKAGMLVRWTDISIPLVYTQVATMAVYSFFSFSVLGRQFLDPGQHYTNRTIDFFVPIFTLLQFVFYMGWLKVAESLVNPFGEDDDDFELECILERHLKMSYLLGDVTPSDDPLAEDDEDDCRWKVCPGAYAAPTEDLAFLTHSGRRREARLRRSMEGEAAAAAAAASSFRRTESDLETAILAPESMCSRGGDFVWEEMDLSGPADATLTPGTTTPTTTTPTAGYPLYPRKPSHPLQSQPASGPTTPTGSNPMLCPSSVAAAPTITTTTPTPPRSPREEENASRDIEMRHTATPSYTQPGHTSPTIYSQAGHPLLGHTTTLASHTHTDPSHHSIQSSSLPGHNSKTTTTSPSHTTTPDHSFSGHMAQCGGSNTSHTPHTSHRPNRSGLTLDGIINPMYTD